MPVYEYQCLKCGECFEEIRQFSDPPLKKHNGCGGRLKKLLSAPAIQFKGTGWYITDYARSGKTKEDKKKDSGSETKAEAKKEDSSSKPAKESQKSEARSQKSE